MTISHFIIAILVGKFSNNWPGNRGAGWASVAFVSSQRATRFGIPPKDARIVDSHTAILLHVELRSIMG